MRTHYLWELITSGNSFRYTHRILAQRPCHTPCSTPGHTCGQHQHGRPHLIRQAQIIQVRRVERSLLGERDAQWCAEERYCRSNLALTKTIEIGNTGSEPSLTSLAKRQVCPSLLLSWLDWHRSTSPVHLPTVINSHTCDAHLEVSQGGPRHTHVPPHIFLL